MTNIHCKNKKKPKLINFVVGDERWIVWRGRNIGQDVGLMQGETRTNDLSILLSLKKTNP